MMGEPDRSCRFCGAVSPLNVNLFGINHMDLVKAAMAVYPTVLYENDPLPKYCCRKCAFQLRTRYSDTQRFIELNIGFINRLRDTKPNHSYIKLIDAIEAAKQDFLNNLKERQKSSTMKLCAERLLNLNKPSIKTCENNSTETSNKLSTLRAEAEASESRDDVPLRHTINVTLEPPATYKAATHKFNNIKCLLQNNSDSTLTLGELTIKKKNHDMAELTVDHRNAAEPMPHCNKRSDMEVPLATLFGVSCNTTYSCKYCQRKFRTKHDLAKHTPQHLRVRMQRIFARKSLPKSLRRARVLHIDDKKLLRCLICYRIYENNAEILSHWNTGKCDFYCLICGKDYSQSGAELRVHVQAVHGLSHSCLRHFHEEMIKPKTELPVPPVKWRNPLIKCSICGKEFQNTQAHRSHMRFHKPTQDASDDNYAEIEDAVHIVIKNDNPDGTQMSENEGDHATKPPTVIVIRGIRAKYNEQTKTSKNLVALTTPKTPPMAATPTTPVTPVQQVMPSRIRVKSLEDLLSTPAKRLMLNESFKYN